MKCRPPAVRHILDLRFGALRVGWSFSCWALQSLDDTGTCDEKNAYKASSSQKSCAFVWFSPFPVQTVGADTHVGQVELERTVVVQHGTTGVATKGPTDFCPVSVTRPPGERSPHAGLVLAQKASLHPRCLQTDVVFVWPNVSRRYRPGQPKGPPSHHRRGPMAIRFQKEACEDREDDTQRTKTSWRQTPHISATRPAH